MLPRNKHLATVSDALALATVAILGATALPAQQTPTIFTICEIASQPDRFDGQLVTVSANVFSDGNHGSMIYDQSCPEYGIDLFVVPGTEGEDRLDAALYWCHLGTRGKLIAGTFTGRFLFEPPSSGEPPRRTIRVRQIADLNVGSTHETSASYPTPCPDPPLLETLVPQMH